MKTTTNRKFCFPTFLLFAMLFCMALMLQGCHSFIGRGVSAAGNGVVSLFKTTPASTALTKEEKAEEEKREIGALEANSKSADTQLATANRAVIQAEKNHGKDSDQAFKAREEAILAHERAVNFGFAYIKSKAEVCSMTLRKTDAKLAELKKAIDASNVSPSDKKELFTEEEAFGKIAEARETTLKELSKKYDTLRNQFVDTYTGPRTVELEENDEVYLPLADVRLLSLGTTPVAQTQKEEADAKNVPANQKLANGSRGNLEELRAAAQKAADAAKLKAEAKTEEANEAEPVVAAAETKPAEDPKTEPKPAVTTKSALVPVINVSNGQAVEKAQDSTTTPTTTPAPAQNPTKEVAKDQGEKKAEEVKKDAPAAPAAGLVGNNNTPIGSTAPATSGTPSNDTAKATTSTTPATESGGSTFWTVFPYLLLVGVICWVVFRGRKRATASTTAPAQPTTNPAPAPAADDSQIVAPTEQPETIIRAGANPTVAPSPRTNPRNRMQAASLSAPNG